MAKSDKESKVTKKMLPKNTEAPKNTTKLKQVDADNDIDGEAEEVLLSTKGAKSLKNKMEDDDEEIVDDEDTVEPVASEDDDDNWDPDFDEFDLPKSKTGKKIGGAKKSGKEDDDDDFKVDEEFKDMMGGGSSKRSGLDDDDDF
jgi:nucleolin